MAENVILSVQQSGAEAVISQLTQIDSLITRLKANRNVKINVSASGLTSAANQAEKLNTSLTNAGTAAKNIGTTGARNVENAGKSLKGASRNAESFNTGLGNVLVTMAKFRLVSAAINLVAGAFKSAFEEMKNVDTELVNIRKVTRFSKAEIDGLTKSAYSLATAYGRGASEVLKASTVFARAGYTDQIEQLSELSLLLQNVGDLQADEASKFIIATDKAYKLGGSYEELMTVIDGLDNITNKNATDMQKMTEGMTVAGSVFAESGESIEMYAALLGTATANTQRSGAEVARGLRTILMNLRQIRGETEDGELIDGESIAQAATALKEYAGISTMENGQLRKASDVLAELAAKWDTLSETQKAAISEAVAGKRQANILMTLMGDWGSVEKMMQEYETGAGTAAQENEIYMESWAAKVQQVSSAWDELVATVSDTEAIKSSLDGVSTVLKGLSEFFSTPTGQYIADILTSPLPGTASTGYGLFTQLGNATTQQVTGAPETVSSEELKRYDDLISRVDSLNFVEYQELQTIQAKIKARDEEVAAAKRAADAVAAIERGKNAISNLNNIQASLESVRTQFEKDFDSEKMVEGLKKIVDEGKNYYETLMLMKHSGQQLTEQESKFVKSYEAVQQGLEKSDTAAELFGYTAAAAALSAGDSFTDAAVKANEAANDITIAINKIPANKTVTIDIVPSVTGDITSEVLRGLPHHASGTRGAPGGPSLVNENGPELIAANGLAWIAGGGKPTVTMLPRGATVLTAQQTKNAFGGKSYNGIPAYEGGTAGSGITTEDIANAFVDGFFILTTGSTADEFARKIGNKTEIPSMLDAPSTISVDDLRGDLEWNTGKKTKKGGKNNRNSGSGSWSGGVVDETPNFKALEDDLSKLLKNLDAQAKLAENEEDYLKAMMVYGEAQAAIAGLLEQYRANGYADDSDEVLRLANLGYDYAAKQLGGYDKLQQNLIDALNALTQSTDDANALEEKRQAVENARQALANAEKQRTVRVFNPVTGQWEWVANASDIAKAQENLKKAEESLRKEELNQAVNAIKNAKPEELGGMTLSPAILEALFGGTPEQQTAFLNALGAASGGANWLASNEAQTAWNQGNNIGTQYNLNGITLTEAQASGMTIKELIATLQGLKIM